MLEKIDHGLKNIKDRFLYRQNYKSDSELKPLDNINVMRPKILHLDENGSIETDIGETIVKLIRKYSKNPQSLKHISKLMAKTSRMISRMISRGVLHGDLHIGNMTKKKNRTGVIDFEIFKTQRINWNDFNDVYFNTRFMVEYFIEGFIESTKNLPAKFVTQIVRDSLARIVLRFPCSPKFKNELVRKYKQNIIRGLRSEGEYREDLHSL